MAAREAHAQTDWNDTSPLKVKDITELDLGDLLAAPVIESAARRKQSIEDAPAAMDVFTADEIAAAGITSLAEILRRVPGMYVVQTNAGRFDVGLRGVAGIANNRVLVLLNGRRLMEADRGSPSWQFIPIHVGEVESIEVLRGPGTILYGADAVSGVINITTKTPLDHPGIEVVFAAGNGWLPDVPNDLESTRVSNIGTGYATYSLGNPSGRLGGSLTAGWNHMPEWAPADPTSVPQHGDFGYHLGATLDWRKDERTSLLLDLRQVQSEGLQTIDALTSQAFYHDSNEQSVTATFRRGELFRNTTLTLNGDYRRVTETTTLLVPRKNFEPVSASNPQDVVERVAPINHRAHLLAQADIDLRRVLTVVSLGVESAYQRSLAFFGTDYSQIYDAAVLQSETRLFSKLLLNLGLRAESVDVTADGRGSARYVNLSPRLSLVSHLNGDHSLRLAAASAYRTPSLWEIVDLPDQGERQYPPPVPLPNTMRGNLSLRPEQVRSLELGYRGRPVHWLRLDLTGYYQYLDNLIAFQQTQLPMSYENSPSRTHAGFELGARFRPMTQLSAHAAYSLTRTKDTSASQSTGDFPTHILQLGADASARTFRFNVDFYYASAINPLLLESSNAGLVFSRPTSNSQLILNARIGKQLFGGAGELFIQGTNLLAALRSRADLVQYPLSGSHPIGLTVLMGIQVSKPKPGGGK
jgi:iron complex outermembrane receptor protein